MIFYSLTQLNSLVATFIASLLFASLVILFKTIFVYNYCNKIVKNFLLFILTLFGGTIFLLTTHLFCYGEYSIFLLAVYLIFFFLVINWCKKLLDFFSSKVYHVYIKVLVWEKKTIARKFGSIKD